MKSLWLLLSTLSIANVVALGGVVGWLAATDRLSTERVQELREVFGETLAEEKARLEAEAVQQQQADAERAEVQRGLGVPQTASQLVSRQEEVRQVEQLQRTRLDREIDALRITLDRERAELDRDKAEFIAMRDAFEAHRKALEELEGTEQFRKAVTTLEAQKPAEARAMLQSLLDERKDDEVVSYLNAMDERIRGKVVAEFAKNDPAVAAELLERLRTRGLDDPDPEEPPG